MYVCDLLEMKAYEIVKNLTLYAFILIPQAHELPAALQPFTILELGTFVEGELKRDTQRQ